jgi:hypothetical protein
MVEAMPALSGKYAVMLAALSTHSYLNKISCPLY